MNKPLYDACREDMNYIIQKLLNNGANINAITRFGLTGLIAACEGAHYHTVEFLIEEGASVNKQGTDDNTPSTSLVM